MAPRGYNPRSALNSTIEEGECQDEDDKFEAYDSVKWELATEKEIVDKARDEKNVPEIRLSRIDEVVPEKSSIPTSPII